MPHPPEQLHNQPEEASQKYQQELKKPKLSQDEELENVKGEIQARQSEIKKTKAELNETREKLGLPPTEEDAPSIHSEKDEIEKLKAEQEVIEMREVEKGFARELRETPRGKFNAKLKKLAGAFALAGLFLFNQREAIAPEPSEEVKAIEAIKESLEEIQENKIKLYEKILDEIREKGAVPLSSQLPETLYKNKKLYLEAEVLAYMSEVPFYNKPDVILGKEFIENDPEKAKEYLEKITDAMEATVRIKTPYGVGSGIIIEEKEGKKLIITNAHVVENERSVFITPSTNGRLSIKCNVIAKGYSFESHDEYLKMKKFGIREKDIAVLEIPSKFQKDLEGTKGLELETASETENEETIATIGQPLAYPFGVGIGKAIKIPKSNKLLYRPDERFKYLELYAKKDEYFIKGDAISGMSGGPIISLDRKDKPKLLGINVNGLNLDYARDDKKYGDMLMDSIIGIENFSTYMEKMELKDSKLGAAIPSKDIIEFLKEHNLYENPK